ncbi:LDB1 [Lepeophtheirus salmonis]|uniref:LDB1 n=1 Tax=Lepeophtheirus salmonis TaxID=72036 RepID=A0A7R8CN04_LEPSM|nr:LDB1 [Lepeophtheirus salmonis]CAF2870908.1 LDB1 [Lepeophtheirus salmonis]
MVAPPVNSPSRESTPSRGGGGSRSTRGRGGRHSGARSSPHLDLLSGEDLEPTRGGNKRRKRKGPNFSLASQDVMVVGEPSLMGGEFGEEDERLISRLENAQYDPAAAAAQAAAAAAQQHHHHQHMDDGYGPSMAWSSGPPPPQAPPGSIPVSQQQIQQPPPPSSSSVIVPKTELEMKKSPKNFRVLDSKMKGIVI